MTKRFMSDSRNESSASERTGRDPDGTPGTNRAGDGLEIPDQTDPGDVPVSAAGTELERSIGGLGGTAIGVEIMIGAGIFVFPGLAAGRAGPAAMISFALGAVIAMLVALPASERATAMPRSGGGYYFISRALRTFAGTLRDC